MAKAKDKTEDKTKVKKNSGKNSQENDENHQSHGPRPFWSGVLAFGLVSIPVSLFPANRGKPISLKMVDESGTPLKRKYFCEKENKVLERDELIRGYEVNKNTFVTVEDKELEALAPDKSREIDLRRFVALEDVDPIYFNRAYILSPDSASNKAYRLLAKSLEEEKRVGVATFVMRGKEYIVAIIAERGILRAETLRFHDEIRSPEQVGLPELNTSKAPAELTGRMKAAIKSLQQAELETDLLQDKYAQRVIQKVEDKLKKNLDVVRSETQDEGDYDDGEEPADNVIDLMQVLKERLQGKQAEESETAKRKNNGSSEKTHGNKRKEQDKNDKASNAKSAAPKKNGSKSSHSAKARSDGRQNHLQTLSRQELYEQAKRQDIVGRSHMSKQELVRALSQ